MDGILYELIYVLPIYLILVLEGGKYIGFPEKEIPLAIASVFLMSGIVVFKNTKNKLKYLIPGSLVVMAFGFSLLKKPEERFDFLFQNIWVLWLILMAFLCVLIGFCIVRFKKIKLVFSLILVVSAFLYMWFHKDISKLAVTNLFVTLLVYLVDEIQYYWKKSGNADQKKHLIFITPFILVLGITIYFSPVKKDPYDWHFAVVIWEKACDIVKASSRYFPGRNDEYAEVGFSEKAVLVGVIQQHPKDLMTLTVTKGGDPIIYIKGKNFDTFTGREWLSNYRAESKERTIDVLETQFAVKQYDPGYFNDYLKPYSADIEYQIFNTRYLFLPEKAEIYRDELSNIVFIPRQDALVSEKKLGYGSKYSVHYYHMNTNQEEFGEFVSNAQPISEELWSEQVVKFNKGAMSGCLYNDYLLYKDTVKRCYTEDIAISDELREVLNDIYTEDDTDWEKCKKIEEWLGTFEYTKSPGILPDYIDTPEEFLDYFLLEKKAGYCVHYATAFVLLARAEGLPARFAEGLYVKHGAQNTMMLTADMAHAWPEIYFDNVGWIRFEPTPSYKSDYLWALRDRDLEGEEEREVYEGKISDYEFENPYLQDEEETDYLDEEKIKIEPRFIVIPILLCVVFLILFFAIYRLIEKIKFNRMSLTDQAKTLCKANLSLLTFLGVVERHKEVEGETLEELYEKTLPKLNEKALAFIPLYEEMIYGEREVDEEMYETILASRKELFALLKERIAKGKRKATR